MLTMSQEIINILCGAKFDNFQSILSLPNYHTFLKDFLLLYASPPKQQGIGFTTRDACWIDVASLFLLYAAGLQTVFLDRSIKVNFAFVANLKAMSNVDVGDLPCRRPPHLREKMTSISSWTELIITGQFHRIYCVSFSSISLAVVKCTTCHHQFQ